MSTNKKKAKTKWIMIQEKPSWFDNTESFFINLLYAQHIWWVVSEDKDTFLVTRRAGFLWLWRRTIVIRKDHPSILEIHYSNGSLDRRENKTRICIDVTKDNIFNEGISLW